MATSRFIQLDDGKTAVYVDPTEVIAVEGRDDNVMPTSMVYLRGGETVRVYGEPQEIVALLNAKRTSRKGSKS